MRVLAATTELTLRPLNFEAENIWDAVIQAGKAAYIHALEGNISLEENPITFSFHENNKLTATAKIILDLYGFKIKYIEII